MNQVIGKKEIVWGFAGPWYGDYEVYNGDLFINQLNFLVNNGFKSMAIDLNEMEIPSRRDLVADYVQKYNLEMTTHVHISPMADNRELYKKETAVFLDKLNKYRDVLRVPIVTTGPNAGHRFMREPDLNTRLERMIEAFTPIAKACYELGCPLGIENHGDFYCSDLVTLCKEVPHLYMFLDTGNTYLIGEKAIPACKEAAPYTIGTHFKDHYVSPNPERLSFDLDGAPLGKGDVMLEEIFKDIITNSNAQKLILHWELITPKGMNAMECMKQSWTFINYLTSTYMK